MVDDEKMLKPEVDQNSDKINDEGAHFQFIRDPPGTQFLQTTTYNNYPFSL